MYLLGSHGDISYLTGVYAPSVDVSIPFQQKEALANNFDNKLHLEILYFYISLHK